MENIRTLLENDRYPSSFILNSDYVASQILPILEFCPNDIYRNIIGYVLYNGYIAGGSISSLVNRYYKTLRPKHNINIGPIKDLDIYLANGHLSVIKKMISQYVKSITIESEFGIEAYTGATLYLYEGTYKMTIGDEDVPEFKEYKIVPQLTQTPTGFSEGLFLDLIFTDDPLKMIASFDLTCVQIYLKLQDNGNHILDVIPYIDTDIGLDIVDNVKLENRDIENIELDKLLHEIAIYNIVAGKAYFTKRFINIARLNRISKYEDKGYQITAFSVTFKGHSRFRKPRGSEMPTIEPRIKFGYKSNVPEVTTTEILGGRHREMSDVSRSITEKVQKLSSVDRPRKRLGYIPPKSKGPSVREILKRSSSRTTSDD